MREHLLPAHTICGFVSFPRLSIYRNIIGINSCAVQYNNLLSKDEVSMVYSYHYSCCLDCFLLVLMSTLANIHRSHVHLK